MRTADFLMIISGNLDNLGVMTLGWHNDAGKVWGLSRGEDTAGMWGEAGQISVSRERGSEAVALSLSPCSWSVRERVSVPARLRDSTDRKSCIASERWGGLYEGPLSSSVIIAGGHRKAEHEGGGGGPGGPGRGGLPSAAGSDAGHPRQSPCCVSSLTFQNNSVNF